MVLNNRYFGDQLKEPVAKAATAYLATNAATLYQNPQNALKACTDFGLDGVHRLQGWLSLLKEMESHASGNAILQ